MQSLSELQCTLAEQRDKPEVVYVVDMLVNTLADRYGVEDEEYLLEIRNRLWREVDAIVVKIEEAQAEQKLLQEVKNDH